MTDSHIDENDLDAALAVLGVQTGEDVTTYEFAPQNAQEQAQETTGADTEAGAEADAAKPAPDVPALLTYAEACELLGISRPTLYVLIEEGAFPVISFGKRAKRIAEADLHVYAKRSAGMGSEEANDPATPSPLDDELLTYDETAEVLRISTFTLRSLVRAGLISPVRFAPRTHRFQRADVVALSRSGISTEEQ